MGIIRQVINHQPFTSPLSMKRETQKPFIFWKSSIALLHPLPRKIVFKIPLTWKKTAKIFILTHQVRLRSEDDKQNDSYTFAL